MTAVAVLAMIFGLFCVWAVPASIVEAIKEHRDSESNPAPHPWRWALIAAISPIILFTLRPGFAAIYLFVIGLYGRREICYALVGWAYQHNRKYIWQLVFITAFFCALIAWFVMLALSKEV